MIIMGETLRGVIDGTSGDTGDAYRRSQQVTVLPERELYSEIVG